MKTTIELPDALAAEAKQVGHDLGVTLRELMVSGLRAELDRRRQPVSVDLVFPTVTGRGLVVEIEDVLDRSYGLPGGTE